MGAGLDCGADNNSCNPSLGRNSLDRFPSWRLLLRAGAHICGLPATPSSVWNGYELFQLLVLLLRQLRAICAGAGLTVDSLLSPQAIRAAPCHVLGVVGYAFCNWPSFGSETPCTPLGRRIRGSPANSKGTPVDTKLAISCSRSRI